MVSKTQEWEIDPDARTKRITVCVSPNIDVIKQRLKVDSGVDMTYVQVFDFLIHYYMKHANEPKTAWRPLS
jgi:hypothetical protein